MKSSVFISFGLALGMGASGAGALTAPLACLNEIEDDLAVDNVIVFGDSGSGLAAEDAMVLHETEQAGGRNYHFPALRAKSLAPYQQDQQGPQSAQQRNRGTT